MVQIYAVIPVYLKPEKRPSKIQENKQNCDMDPDTESPFFGHRTANSFYFFCCSLAHSLSHAPILSFISESAA